MEVPSVDDVQDQEEEDWAVQYQAYLDEKDAMLNEDGEDVPSRQGNKSPQGEDWAVQYAEYCIEKEKEFFQYNQIKES
jgi:hypothetical protein